MKLRNKGNMENCCGTLAVCLFSYCLISSFSHCAAQAEPAPRVFPFAMEGANLPNIWEMAGSREPAGSGGFLVAKGSDFVDATGRKRRFFGVNLYGPAALPAKVNAPAMAERIARWGINAVRVLPQYVWQLRADKDFSKGIDPDLLDRFDWLFFQLKQRGISVDMNLHSARTAGYRFKDFKQTMKENKGLDNFDPTFILHQKEFIRDIFNHVNPYTGLAYRDDPAVMTWEINNECSMAESWFWRKLEEKLTPYFRRELERQFCDWLRTKYGTTARLREAWSMPSLEDEAVGLGQESSAVRTHDISEFVLDVEDRYWKEMYEFVKNEMAARAPVNCGTADYGAHYPQAYGDFIDDHFYFGGFPVFPGKSWDRSNWYCMNRSMVRNLDLKTGGRTLQRVFENRVFGKPFTISEANVPTTPATAAEFFPITLSLAAFQNTAAVHGYAWSHAADHSYGGWQFFDMRGNAKFLAHLPASLNMFVRGDVKSGEDGASRIAYALGRLDERETIIKRRFSGSTHIGDTDPQACLKAPTGRVLPDLPQKCDIETVPYGKPEGATRATVSSTGEIRWDATKAGEEWYAVDTPRTKFLSVFGKTGAIHTFGDGFMVTLGDTLMGWAAISFTELSPGRSLLAATGYQQPSGAKLALAETWEPIPPEDGVRTLDLRISTAKAMGKLPYLCEGVRATIRVPSAEALRVTPLDGDARPLSDPFVAEVSDGVATFDISEKYHTVWYLVEKTHLASKEP